MSTDNISNTKSSIKSHQHYDLDINCKFQSTMRKIRHRLSHHHTHKVSDIIPSGNMFVFFLIKTLYRVFETFSLKDINESKKSTYVLDQRQSATIFVSNHISHSDPFVISELFSRHRTSLSYILSFSSSHLNTFPLNIFYKASSSFIKRNDKMDTQDKLLLQEYICECKKHDLSFFLYPEGTFSVSGNAIKMKLGLLKYLIKADYENMVIVKVQYTKILDFDLHSTVRKEGSWPKNNPLSFGVIIERLKQIFSYSSSVYVDTKKMSLLPFSEKNIDLLAMEVGFQLNNMYLFSDMEKIKTALYISQCNRVNINELSSSIIGYLDANQINEVKYKVLKVCNTFNFDIVNDEIILNKNGCEELFTSINQYIYAWLPYAIKACRYTLSPIEMECLYLNKVTYKEMTNIELNTEFIKFFEKFDIQSHLHTIVKSFDIR
ncbi:1-acyl-sn-glycerol-3-phosphate acyltransferase [uncultured Shewanella sp.]|uniref:1-acyl-sn-glycerol-3-phosphate acyltransferase n=1 Tax=uncultured Shewanella sp. TaxID=173975 RepID=UPI00260E02B4|nr:1-acyl-sn-glycerol-3-phosphate acyltransferase [uncultured Shewanella sp.]